ncbi:hypothetical protein [Isoptericola cucumis]|uniref:Uncharacterized protein n=1 Tax=Isoptericola cucumis TaxID=1776856 RepID=A0ABQ2BDW1_9MICO|nr:hypothetical protein [Isoptericola cucumis]GGI11841.1 hypothetical protein GCM10007368_38200 [Isoptericola cucumis]
MAAQTRTRAGSTVTRCVLTVVLLALTVLLGTTVLETAGPSPAATSSASNTFSTSSTSDHVVAAGGEHYVEALGAAAHGALPDAYEVVEAGHGDEPVSLLCLCALLVAGIAMLVRGAATLWRQVASAGDRGLRAMPAGLGGASLQRRGALAWGVCRR